MALQFLNNGYFAGKVGIGTDSPNGKLEVNGIVKIGNVTTGLSMSGSSATEFLISGADTGGNAWNSIHIKADGNDGLFIEKDTNNVGIGTTSPSQKLHVDGSIKVNANGFFGPGGTVTTDGIVSIDGGSGTGGEAYLRLMRGGTSGFILNHTATAIQVRATANIPMFFYTNDTIGIKLNANSTIALPEYGAGYLKTDGSGNVTADATVPGTGTFLPLAGGTMTGATLHGDSVHSYWGASNDLQIYHNGTDSYISNTQNVSDLIIENGGNDKDIIFKCDDGLGGKTSYFYLDGSKAIPGCQWAATCSW